MIADKSDVRHLIAKKHSEAGQRMLPMARLLAGAAPVMDKLARSEEWGQYCTYLQGMSDRFVGSKQAALQKLSDPSITKDEEVRKLRQDVFEADVWIRAMQFAIELPAAILAGKEEADKFVASMEKKNENVPA